MNLNKFLRFVLAQSLNCVQLFVTPWTVSLQAPLSSTISQSLLKFIPIEMMMLPNHLILCHPSTLLPSIFPNIKVFFNEIALHIRCPKYQSLSFSNNPYNEYLEFISFRILQFDLLAVQDTLKSISSWNSQVSSPFSRLQFKSINSLACAQSSLGCNSHICTWLLENHNLWLSGSLSAKWCLPFSMLSRSALASWVAQ